MESLPLELYSILFSYVDINDLFSLRLLNKNFNYIVSQYRIEELVVFDSWIFKITRRYFRRQARCTGKSNWFFRNLPKNYLRLVDTTELFILKEPAHSALFCLKFLKRLKVDYCIFRPFRLKHVNHFNRLEQLEIVIGNESDGDQLHLPNLQVLCIAVCSLEEAALSIDAVLSIDAAKLVAVCFGRYDYHSTSPGNFEFKHPLSVTYLKTGRYHSSILAFSNLQNLEISREAHFDPTVLSKFADLKELTVLGIEKSRLDSIIRASSSNRSTLTIHHKPCSSFSLHSILFYSSLNIGRSITVIGCARQFGQTSSSDTTASRRS